MIRKNAARTMSAVLGVAVLCAAASLTGTAAQAVEKPVVPRKYLDEGVHAGMLCATGVISFCDPGSTVGQGILAEFAHIWGEEAGVKVDVVGSSWEALMPSAISGRTDVVAGIGDYESRHNQFTFVNLFWNSDSFLVPAGNPLGIKAPMDLCGRRMSAATGSGELMTVRAISAECVKQGKPAIVEVEFGEQPPTFLAVQTDRADATVTDIFAADELIKNNPKVYAEGFRKRSEWMWGVAVPVANKDMLALVSYGVQQAIADGKFKAVLDKYGFGEILADRLMVNTKPAE
ncbi:transporter substrate-binding domain-containing protein [Mesorhizobium sp. INR15]|uniref:transporter substrate-binding domain-containing protein n=1 Tax=Mesorhizobium sp. INR15 TaxID=2654248 RepID=UPI0018969A07|nr:transporter substrate-binding domain-containing protein [Mesorhizobium sp. INR15]QPC91766.1 transporter substrate-binding domain-containing protein [Mesorhizobium sp. INR15]